MTYIYIEFSYIFGAQERLQGIPANIISPTLIPGSRYYPDHKTKFGLNSFLVPKTE